MHLIAEIGLFTNNHTTRSSQRAETPTKGQFYLIYLLFHLFRRRSCLLDFPLQLLGQ